MSVLHGAAGVAHDLETTRLLLDRGATVRDTNDGAALGGVDRGSGARRPALAGAAGTAAPNRRRAAADPRQRRRQRDRGAPARRGRPAGWTAWGSREIPGAAGRQDAYVEAAKLLLAAGARVDQGMIEVASDTVAEVLEDAARKRPARD